MHHWLLESTLNWFHYHFTNRRGNLKQLPFMYTPPMFWTTAVICFTSTCAVNPTSQSYCCCSQSSYICSHTCPPVLSIPSCSSVSTWDHCLCVSCGVGLLVIHSLSFCYCENLFTLFSFFKFSLLKIWNNHKVTEKYKVQYKELCGVVFFSEPFETILPAWCL